MQRLNSLLDHRWDCRHVVNDDLKNVFGQSSQHIDEELQTLSEAPTRANGIPLKDGFQAVEVTLQEVGNARRQVRRGFGREGMLGKCCRHKAAVASVLQMNAPARFNPLANDEGLGARTSPDARLPTSTDSPESTMVGNRWKKS